MNNNQKSLGQYAKDIEDELKNLGYRYTSSDTNIASNIRSQVENDGKTLKCAILDFIEFEKNSFEKIETINIVKRTCKELGLTYKELGDAIGYSEPAIKKSVQTNKISEPMQKAIDLYKETIELKNRLQNTDKLTNALKELLN